MILPSPNPVTPGYGFGSTLPPYSATNKHKGTDFRYNPDHNAYASSDGSVALVPWNGTSPDGNMAILTFSDSRGAWRLAYCHFASFSVKSGPVKQGQVLGIMGDTGAAEGKHLHVTTRLNGNLVDIMDYVGGEMFNEGDRRNINFYFYGEDRGRFKEAVGKDWKLAMYSGIFETDAFKIDQLFNEGDARNVKAKLGDASKCIGKPWKNFWYEFADAKFTNKPPEPLPPGVYEVKS